MEKQANIAYEHRVNLMGLTKTEAGNLDHSTQ